MRNKKRSSFLARLTGPNTLRQSSLMSTRLSLLITQTHVRTKIKLLLLFLHSIETLFFYIWIGSILMAATSEMALTQGEKIKTPFLPINHKHHKQCGDDNYVAMFWRVRVGKDVRIKGPQLGMWTEIGKIQVLFWLARLPHKTKPWAQSIWHEISTFCKVYSSNWIIQEYHPWWTGAFCMFNM